MEKKGLLQFPLQELPFLPAQRALVRLESQILQNRGRNTFK